MPVDARATSPGADAATDRIERRAVSGLSVAAFRAEYARPDTPRPVILETGNRSLASIWNDDYLRRRLGRSVVSIYVSADGTFPGGEGPFDPERYRLVELPFDECLARIQGAELSPILAPGELCYLYQLPARFFAPLLRDYVQSEYVPASHASSCNLWLSGAGAVTPLHYDISDNILVQIRGRKHVWLFSPDQYPWLYLKPLGDPHSRQSAVDVNRPNLRDFPAFAKARAWRGELGAGDLLFIPAGWGHAINTLELSISINHAWSTPEVAEVCAATVALLRSPRAQLRALATHLLNEASGDLRR